MKAQWTLGVAAVAAVLNWLAGFGLGFLTPGEAAIWITVVNAVALLVVALKTRPVAPQVWTYVITSGAALISAYGGHLDQHAVSSFSLAFLAVLAFIGHGFVSPKSDVDAARARSTVEGKRVV